MNAVPEPRRILVLGATGYVGGRLVPELLSAGLRVRCLTRTPAGLSGIGWSSDVEIVEGDLSDASSLGAAFAAVDEVVYLVHSLGAGDDFMQQERVTACNTRVAAEAAGVSRIVYVGGLGDDADDLTERSHDR